MSGVFPARTGGFAARRHYGIAVFTQRRRPRELLQAVSRTHMKPAPAIYATPHKPHEWWRGTLPTVPRDDDWEAVIKQVERVDRKSTRLNSSHVKISYAVFCLKKKKTRAIGPNFSRKKA